MKAVETPTGKVFVPDAKGYTIDTAKAQQTGETMYINNETGKDYFAWDANAKFLDQNGTLIQQGMMLLTTDGAHALDPESTSNWAMLPGVAADYNATLTYQIVDNLFGQPGTTGIIVTSPGSGFNLISSNPHTGKIDIIPQYAKKPDGTVFAPNREFFGKIKDKNLQITYGWTFFNSNLDPTQHPTLSFGQHIAPNVNKVAFIYGNGGSTPTGTDYLTHMIKVQTTDGKTLYVGGFVK